MKLSSKHQEILFFINATQKKTELANNQEQNHCEKIHAIQDLESACWNGLIYKLLPKIPCSTYSKCESILWQVLADKKFLYINIGPTPLIADYSPLIDPYFFMMNICKS